MLADEARRLEAAGAEAILICANTMHLVFEAVRAAVSAPVLHICDATAASLKAAGSARPLLLATRFTMEMPFYRDPPGRGGDRGGDPRRGEPRAAARHHL